jgi:hypothetical protein
MRLIYFFYYLKQLDSEKLKLFQGFIKQKKGISVPSQWIRIIYNVLRYKISILEYYQFRFFEKNHEEKLFWAGTGYMYEFQKIMNPPAERDILDDKRKFYQKYREFFVHHVFTQDELRGHPENLDLLFQSTKVVFKFSDGKCGVGVEIVETSTIKKEHVLSFMTNKKLDMVESFIIQHPDLQALAPNAVNTVRIFTQLNRNNEVEILGCRQRLSIYSTVDNMAAGNVAAPINEQTGIIEGPGVYSDITKDPETIHPVSGLSIVGFQVPYWRECLDLAKKAALKHPQNRSIGWDIVVTENGPGLIEGNHDWCKLVWQLPVNQGLKTKLEAHV